MILEWVGLALTALTLAPDGAGCVYTGEHSVSVGIPLIGRRLEEFLLQKLHDGLVRELPQFETELQQGR